MRRLWTEDRVTHQGRFYQVTDAGLGAKPVRAGGPPLYIAGFAPPAVRRAARIGDAWLIMNNGLGTVAPLMQTYRDALKEYGRTPAEYPITVECYVGARHATAHEECRGPLEYKYNAYAAWGMMGDRPTQSFADLARDRFIIGDKVSVKEEIARYRELLGVDHFIMRCQWPGLPQERVLEFDQAARRDLRGVVATAEACGGRSAGNRALQQRCASFETRSRLRRQRSSG